MREEFCEGWQKYDWRDGRGMSGCCFVMGIAATKITFFFFLKLEEDCCNHSSQCSSVFGFPRHRYTA